MNSNQEEKNDLFDEQVNRDHKEVKPMFTTERTITIDQEQKLRDSQKSCKNGQCQNCKPKEYRPSNIKPTTFKENNGIKDINLKTLNIKIIDQEIKNKGFYHFDNGQKNELND